MGEELKPIQEGLSPEAQMAMVGVLEGMMHGIGFASLDINGKLIFGPSTKLMNGYLRDDVIKGRINNLYENRNIFKYVDPESQIVTYRTNLVNGNSQVFSLCLKENGENGVIVQIDEVKHDETNTIDLLGDLLTGVAFGSTVMEEISSGQPTSKVEFSSKSPSMDHFIQDPDLLAEITLLTQKENLLDGTAENVEIYKKQIVSESGKIYNIQAKKMIDGKFLYTVDEVIQQVDPMTGLGSKYAHEAKLKEVEALMRREIGDGKKPSVAVIFIDLDDFKIVNDKYGHTEGDKIIKEVGRVLKASLRETDFISRLGGDEYAIIIENTDPAGIEAIKRKIIENFIKANEGIPEEDKKMKLSFGIAANTDPAIERFSNSWEMITPKIVEMMADQKMYETKRSKKVIREINRLRSIGAYEENAYIEVIEKIFNLRGDDIQNSDQSWRVRQESLKSIADYIFMNGLLGPKEEDEAKSLHKKLIKAIFFQDLISYTRAPINFSDSKFGEEIPDSNIDKSNYIEIKPVNSIHPQLSKEFVLSLKELNLKELTPSDLDEIASIVEYQHSWVDGRQSPVLIKGEEIPDLSKWLSLINAYFAMVTRTYDKRKTSEQAMGEIISLKGWQFDPEKADAFVNIMRNFEVDTPWDKGGNNSREV